MKIRLKNLINLTFSSLCVALTLIGMLLFSYMKKTTDLNEHITVTVYENTYTSLYVDLKDINPGSETNYVINVEGDDLSNFDFTLNFSENNNSGRLDEYLSVEIKANDFCVEKNLHEILYSEEEFKLGKNVKLISLTYKMDESIGNEAQDAFANFLIYLTATKEGSVE